MTNHSTAEASFKYISFVAVYNRYYTYLPKLCYIVIQTGTYSTQRNINEICFQAIYCKFDLNHSLYACVNISMKYTNRADTIHKHLKIVMFGSVLTVNPISYIHPLNSTLFVKVIYIALSYVMGAN